MTLLHHRCKVLRHLLMRLLRVHEFLGALSLGAQQPFLGFSQSPTCLGVACVPLLSVSSYALVLLLQGLDGVLGLGQGHSRVVSVLAQHTIETLWW